MAKTPKTREYHAVNEARSLIAVVEERNAQIRELEREIEKLTATIRVRDGQLVDTERRYDQRIGNLTEQIASFRSLWEKETAKAAQLAGVIATMDDKAVKKTEDRLGAIIVGKDREITDLKDRSARAEGWIDATLGNHPTRGGKAEWRGGTMDRVRNAMKGVDPAAGRDITTAVIAWRDGDGKWRVRPAEDEEIPF